MSRILGKMVKVGKTAHGMSLLFLNDKAPKIEGNLFYLSLKIFLNFGSIIKRTWKLLACQESGEKWYK